MLRARIAAETFQTPGGGGDGQKKEAQGAGGEAPVVVVTDSTLRQHVFLYYARRTAVEHIVQGFRRLPEEKLPRERPCLVLLAPHSCKKAILADWPGLSALDFVGFSLYSTTNELHTIYITQDLHVPSSLDFSDAHLFLCYRFPARDAKEMQEHYGALSIIQLDPATRIADYPGFRIIGSGERLMPVHERRKSDAKTKNAWLWVRLTYLLCILLGLGVIAVCGYLILAKGQLSAIAGLVFGVVFLTLVLLRSRRSLGEAKLAKKQKYPYAIPPPEQCDAPPSSVTGISKFSMRSSDEADVDEEGGETTQLNALVAMPEDPGGAV